jgi:hypothetical protein
MIIGSGLIALAFAARFANEKSICVYAAGVSNSTSDNSAAFERERSRLAAALDKYFDSDAFVYFGTCSANDLSPNKSAYVCHKLRMEEMVRTHPRYLIIRLPQVVGLTANAHTLVNFLFERIEKGDPFKVWAYARRNLIDIDDVVRLTTYFLLNEGARCETINIANVRDIGVIELVGLVSKIIGKDPVIEIIEKRDDQLIDVDRVRSVASAAGVNFDQDYIERILLKYYGNGVYDKYQIVHSDTCLS